MHSINVCFTIHHAPIYSACVCHLLQGWKQTSWYQWDFNDTSAPVNITGFDSASTQNHIFTHPGRYEVRVQAGNNAGSSATVFEITIYGECTLRYQCRSLIIISYQVVMKLMGQYYWCCVCMTLSLSLSLSLCLDIIQSVLIKPPIQASGNGSVPTGISLIFRANKTTQYNTDIVESVTYTWLFGDGGQGEVTSEPIISHIFYAPGNYDITLSVVAAYSQGRQTTYTITVYESKAPPITPPIVLL